MFEFAWTRHFQSDYPKDATFLMMNLMYPYVRVTKDVETDKNWRYEAKPQITEIL